MGMALLSGTAEPKQVICTAVQVAAGDSFLAGDLEIPAGACGVVLFAHGSGSSRFSPRNQFVARSLQRGGFGTCLIDLLTPQEEAVDVVTAQYRFAIELLAERLSTATVWLFQQGLTQHLPIGYFGASTGAAAALIAATKHPQEVRAIVSRGGRPDLAGSALGLVRAPTLFIVGGHDQEVLSLNREALAQMQCERSLEIVPGATHLFEEPGALEHVAELALGWFQGHLP